MDQYVNIFNLAFSSLSETLDHLNCVQVSTVDMNQVDTGGWTSEREGKHLSKSSLWDMGLIALAQLTLETMSWLSRDLYTANFVTKLKIAKLLHLFSSVIVVIFLTLKLGYLCLVTKPPLKNRMVWVLYHSAVSDLDKVGLKTYTVQANTINICINCPTRLGNKNLTFSLIHHERAF